MTALIDRHKPLLDQAMAALHVRQFWTPFPEIPSGKIYGDSAKTDGERDFQALIGQPFDIPGHPETHRVGAEESPWGLTLGVTYPAADAETLIRASEAAAPAWADASPEARAGVLAEVLVRLNAQSFLIGHATMHTTGQAFPMAFQAGGPHAQDRALEALAVAYGEQTRFATAAQWTKPQGKAAPLSIEKHWTIVPRGLALAIGCNTFPTWNSYPGIFASLATGNTVIVKPHPNAILPLALTVRMMRDVLAEAGFPRDVILLATDEAGAEITRALVTASEVQVIDYTGSNAFGTWVRDNAAGAQVFTEEAGVNSVVIAGTDDFDAMCANLAFSLALYSGQMCTAPQNFYVPADGIDTDQGHKSFDDVATALAAAVDHLLADPAAAAAVAGRIANPATLDRVRAARGLGTVVRESSPLDGTQSATPLILAVDADATDAHKSEQFGPIAFVIRTKDTTSAIDQAAELARQKGAITVAYYDTDESRIDHAIRAFARAGVNLSINLTGNIYVNQSAAFSDFHVTGANPAGNASLTDTAFVAPRFTRAMWRRPVPNAT